MFGVLVHVRGPPAPWYKDSGKRLKESAKPKTLSKLNDAVRQPELDDCKTDTD